MYINLSFAMFNTDNTLWIIVFSICWSLTVTVASIAEQSFGYLLCVRQRRFPEILTSTDLKW